MNQGIMPDAIGVTGLNLQDAVSFAGRNGFDSVMLNMREVHAIVQEHGADYVVDLFGEYGVKPGAWGLPLSWSNDEKRNAGLAELPDFMETAHAIGCTRAVTGMDPGVNDVSFEQHFENTVNRLRPVAELLETGGIKAGIEFVGTPSYRRERWNTEFIHDLKGTMELINAVGRPSLGVLFDVWHHWVSGGTMEEIDALSADDVVVVHVNDAPQGLAIDEQIDTQRTLPMATGVIPVPEMLKRLQAIGFDGPVMPEPFSASLEELAARDPDAAGAKTKEAMDALWQAAGFSV